MNYLLDSNVFIQAKNGYYSFDIAPGFWRWLEILAEEQAVLTVKAVREEIIDGNDALRDWMADFPKEFFAEPDIPVQENLRKIVTFIMQEPRFAEHHRYSFLEKADPWLIATAMTGDFTIVTHEEKTGPGSTKVKIPNICEVFQVPFLSVFDLMKAKKVRLHL
ncbi:MAG: DUF4411 family protein [Methanospirillaceae archaeon]|nr:DUF4411 family protein [Methanospirillaceae archaeon]